MLNHESNPTELQELEPDFTDPAWLEAYLARQTDSMSSPPAAATGVLGVFKKGLARRTPFLRQANTHPSGDSLDLSDLGNVTDALQETDPATGEVIVALYTKAAKLIETHYVDTTINGMPARVSKFGVAGKDPHTHRPNEARLAQELFPKAGVPIGALSIVFVEGDTKNLTTANHAFSVLAFQGVAAANETVAGMSLVGGNGDNLKANDTRQITLTSKVLASIETQTVEADELAAAQTAARKERRAELWSSWRGQLLKTGGALAAATLTLHLMASELLPATGAARSEGALSLRPDMATTTIPSSDEGYGLGYTPYDYNPFPTEKDVSGFVQKFPLIGSGIDHHNVTNYSLTHNGRIIGLKVDHNGCQTIQGDYTNGETAISIDYYNDALTAKTVGSRTLQICPVAFLPSQKHGSEITSSGDSSNNVGASGNPTVSNSNINELPNSGMNTITVDNNPDGYQSGYAGSTIKIWHKD